MKTNSIYLRAGYLLMGVLMTLALLQADDVDAPLAGHSLHGDAYDEGPRQAAYLMEGMPRIDFPVTTANPEAQKFFNQGVGQLHGFWFFEAERSFRQVALLDTNCAMARWGMAMANVSNDKRAKEFIRDAVAGTNSANVSRRETLYIDSLAKFHRVDKKAEKPKADAKTDNKTPAAKPSDDAEVKRHRDYVRSLEQIIEEFPNDLEAKAFLVFKIWDNAGRIKISSHTAADSLAKEILAVNPLHPVQHARIHFWNNEADRRAVEAAARCGQGSPGIAHMWHMSGHTYSALRRYGDAAWQQEAAARVDHAYMIRNHVLPDRIHNFAHNNDWLIRNLDNIGRVRAALDLARNMIELPRHPKYNNLSKLSGTNSSPKPSRENSAFYGRRRLMEALIKWELWDDLIALGATMYLDETNLPEEQVKRLKAIGLAYFAKGNLVEGERQIAEIEAVLKTQRGLRSGEMDEAEAKARKEDKTDDVVAKAVTDVMKTYSENFKNFDKVITELRLFKSLAKGDKDDARKLASDLKDVSKDRLARVWLQLGDQDKAIKLAREAVEGATNQVHSLANYADILARSDKKDEAAAAFKLLRAISTQADLDVPIMQRLKPIATQLDLPGDWRLPFQQLTDVGERPSLDSLGPFRWHPSPAPGWTLTGSNGKKISLKDYRGRPVVVIFYLGYGCKHCLQQLNAFAPLTKRFTEAGISIVAVSTDSVEGLAKTFSQSTDGDGFPFPIVSDEKMEVFKKYRAFDDFEHMPLHGTFLLDGEGLVRWQDISYEPFTRVDFLLTESKRLLKLPAKPTLISAVNKVSSRPMKGAELLALPR